MKKTRTVNLEIVQGESQDWFFEQRENQRHHSPYEWEQILFGCVRDGDVAHLEEMIKEPQFFVGKVSTNDLRQAQYIAVAFITLATRYAIQGGMFEMDAYNKSDAFIQKVDQLVTSEEVIEFSQSTIREMTEEIQQLQVRKNLSPSIKNCLEYIYQNLHLKLDLKILSQKCSLSAPYLSTLFRKEVGIHLSVYIMQQKIKAAQSMIAHSAMSTQEISNYLEFSSQSYFIHCFKRICGCTPAVYRKQRSSHF